MNTHKNARLTAHGRDLLVGRISKTADDRLKTPRRCVSARARNGSALGSSHAIQSLWSSDRAMVG